MIYIFIFDYHFSNGLGNQPPTRIYIYIFYQKVHFAGAFLVQKSPKVRWTPAIKGAGERGRSAVKEVWWDERIRYSVVHGYSTNPRATYPPQFDKGLIAGLIKGNQWLISP